jgi:hypothetical protein
LFVCNEQNLSKYNSNVKILMNGKNKLRIEIMPHPRPFSKGEGSLLLFWLLPVYILQ